LRQVAVLLKIRVDPASIRSPLNLLVRVGTLQRLAHAEGVFHVMGFVDTLSANGCGHTARGFHSSTSAAPPNQATSLESQMIHRIQLLPGQTLRSDISNLL
jgi:hypothetical protein